MSDLDESTENFQQLSLSKHNRKKTNFKLRNFSSRLKKHVSNYTQVHAAETLDHKSKVLTSDSGSKISLDSRVFNRNIPESNVVSSPESSSTYNLPPPIKSLNPVIANNEHTIFDHSFKNDRNKSEFTKYDYTSNFLKQARKSTTVIAQRNGKCIGPQVREDIGKLTLVLDIDETLIHSRMTGTLGNMLRQVEKRKENANNCNEFQLVLSDGETVLVNKRPGLDEFLSHVSQRFEVVAYTAGLEQYASPLLDWLEKGHKNKIFKHRLYRDSCIFNKGYYVKDLQILNRCLSRTVLVDNNVFCFLPQLNNGIPISSFYDDPNDDALTVLKNFLSTLDDAEDVRPVLQRNFNLETLLGEQRNTILG